MTQNLNHYEKILSRSHSNYLAQISIEMTDANNQINDVLSKLTALGTVLIPMNLVTGLWGMNVHVPGQDITVSAFVLCSQLLLMSLLRFVGGICLVPLYHRRPSSIRCHRWLVDVQAYGWAVIISPSHTSFSFLGFCCSGLNAACTSTIHDFTSSCTHQRTYISYERP